MGRFAHWTSLLETPGGLAHWEQLPFKLELTSHKYSELYMISAIKTNKLVASHFTGTEFLWEQVTISSCHFIWFFHAKEKILTLRRILNTLSFNLVETDSPKLRIEV